MQQPHLRGLAWWAETAPLVLPHLAAEQAALLRDELAFQQHLAASPAGQALPRGPIHADLFRDNVMFDDTAGTDRLCGFFDFYFAGTDMLLFDVAVCLNDWCADLASGDLDETRAAAFCRRLRTRAPVHRRRGARHAGAAARRGAALLDHRACGTGTCRAKPRMLQAKDPAHFERVLRVASPRPGTLHAEAPMTLQLKTVPASRGPRWVVDAFRLFARKPLLFTMMFAVFLFAALLVSLVPLLGGLVQMAALPLLSLGFMIAGQSALNGGPVHPAQFIEPLRGDPARRRSLLILCAIYGVAALTILLLADAVSDNAWARLQALMMQGQPAQAEIDALLAEPGVATGLLLAGVLGTRTFGALLARPGAGALGRPGRGAGAVLQHAGGVALQGRLLHLLAGLGGRDRGSSACSRPCCSACSARRNWPTWSACRRG